MSDRQVPLMSPFDQGRFRADCGMPAALELDVLAKGQAPRRHTLAGPCAVLGRDGRASLCLDHADVSQRHAYLQLLGGRLFVVDLDSRSGITLHGAAAPSGWLEPGQRLSLGPFHIERPGASPPCPILPADPLDQPPGHGQAVGAVFEVFLGDRPLARWRMNRVLTLVGRSARCRVRLRDESVSRIHCSLVATAGAVWVIDLLSREGTRWRGEPVRCARLEEGDTVEVGNYRLRIHYRSNRPELPSLPSPPPSPLLVLCQEHAGSLLPSDGGGQNALLPLVQQLAAMQQQMFDQFQQTMVLLAQMVSSMQQGQVSLIREELQHFHKVAQELTQLQRQTSQAPPPRREAETAARWPSPRPGATTGADEEEKSEGAGDTVHVWLHQRIAELKEERQGRWQRLLGLLRGA